MTDLGEHHHGLGDGGLDRAAVAEIRRDRLPEALLVVGDDSAQPRQPVEPLGEAGRRLGPRPRDHGTEGFLNGPKRGARRGAVQGAIQAVVHGIPPLEVTFPPGFVAASWPLVELLARAAQTGRKFVHRAVIKSKKTSPQPFPKAARVGTYRPHPTGFARGCLPRKPSGLTKQATRTAPALHSPSPALSRR